MTYEGVLGWTTSCLSVVNAMHWRRFANAIVTTGTLLRLTWTLRRPFRPISVLYPSHRCHRSVPTRIRLITRAINWIWSVLKSNLQPRVYHRPSGIDHFRIFRLVWCRHRHHYYCHRRHRRITQMSFSSTNILCLIALASNILLQSVIILRNVGLIANGYPAMIYPKVNAHLRIILVRPPFSLLVGLTGGVFGFLIFSSLIY